jgi:cytoskeletal protein CcmA (bactofilin family)
MATPFETPKTEFAHIGKSLTIKGEVTGQEDLSIEGKIDGSVDLHGSILVIGPSGQVRAHVNAKGVIVHGKLEGDINASDRAVLKKSSIVVGNILAQHIAIEDGAYFKGKVEIQRQDAKLEGKADIKPAWSQASTGLASATSAGSNAPLEAKSHTTGNK